MKKKLIEMLGLAPDATDDQVIAEVFKIQGEVGVASSTEKALREQIAKYEKEDAQRKEDEKQINLKREHGLSREQAVSVIERQRQFDADKAAGKHPWQKKKESAPAAK